MDLSSLLPPSDLLQKARGVESGLRQRRRLGAIGWIGFLVISAIELSLEISKLGLVSVFREKGVAALSVHWPLWLLALLAVFFLLLGTWSRFWLKESRQPFRYTCSISSFGAVRSDQTRAHGMIDECMSWLPHDIKRLLNDRVQRFLFASEPPAPASAPAKEEPSDGPAKWDSYIHIGGHYVVRAPRGRSDELEIEVMPLVRIGPPGHPEVMAQSTVFPLPVVQENATLDRSGYEDLLEQVYHAIVTKVYQQLKEDVQRKIDLLPSDRFRATALLYEADDYARSNTLHAYEEARELYWQAAGVADPTWREPPKSRFVHAMWRGRCRVHALRAKLRAVESHYRPRVAEPDVLCVRTLIGYARMLIFRRALAGLVGQTANPIFEVPPVVERALACVLPMSRDVPGLRRAMFDARVTLALARYELGDVLRAREVLGEARGSDPPRAEHNAVFIYASSLLSPSPNQRTRVALLRRAVESHPDSRSPNSSLPRRRKAPGGTGRPLRKAPRNWCSANTASCCKSTPATLPGGQTADTSIGCSNRRTTWKRLGIASSKGFASRISSVRVSWQSWTMASLVSTPSRGRSSKPTSTTSPPFPRFFHAK